MHRAEPAGAPVPTDDHDRLRQGFQTFYDDQWLGLDPYFKVHRSRFLQTWWFVQRLGLPPRGRVLDVGGVGPVAAYLADALGWAAESTSTDLRYELGTMPSDAYDLVLCTETLEHIKDRDSTAIRDLEAFNFSGVLSLLGELARGCSKHGWLVVTTPNANSYISLHKWVAGEALMLDPRHVREFSVSELQALMQKSGLRVLASEVVTSWESSFGGTVAELKRRLADLADRQGVPRGDNIMMAAMKR